MKCCRRIFANQIRPADVMVVSAGMYSVRSGWMGWEMKFARRIRKPIIGIRPWGNRQLTDYRSEECGRDRELEHAKVLQVQINHVLVRMYG